MLLRLLPVVPIMFLGVLSDVFCSSINWRSEGTENLNPDVLNYGVVALNDGAVAAVEFPLRGNTFDCIAVTRDCEVDGLLCNSPLLSRIKYSEF